MSEDENVPTEFVCPDCQGDGYRRTDNGAAHHCETCDGIGRVPVTEHRIRRLVEENQHILDRLEDR